MSEAPVGAASAGALLRTAREKQGLHIAALAAAIKVAPRKLDALEHDRWDELPDATFTRALAQTVCRTLKIDSRAVLDLLPPAGALPLDGARGGLNAPFRERPGREEPGLAVSAIRPMVWAALVLMAAAVVVYFLPEGLWSPRATLAVPAVPAVAARASEALPASPAASEPEPVAAAEPGPEASAALSGALASAPSATAVPAPKVPPSLPAASAPALGAVLATAPASAGPRAAPAPASVPVVLAGAATPRASPAAVASAPAAAVPRLAPAPPLAGVAPASAALVQLRAQEASWVEARDARGQLLVSRIVQPGEGLGLDGSLPIRLTIGNAGATQLSFRGAAVDLAPSTRDNVARVELK